jgi:chromosome segregation ATPase
MSEPVIAFGIGFLLAALLVIGVVLILRARSRRAKPLIEAITAPLMSAIEADMDDIHSQIAVATRRLEICVEQMKLKTTSQLAEIGTTSEALARLKAELVERNVNFEALRERERSVAGQLQAAEATLGTTMRMLEDTEHKLVTRKAEYQKLTEEFEIHPALSKAQARHAAEMERVLADKALIEEQLDHSRAECAKLQDYIASMKTQVETTWASERMANAVLRERINDVASEVVRVAAALEGLNSPIDTLVAGKTANAQAQAESLLPVGAPFAPDMHASGPPAHLPTLGGNGDISSADLIHRIRALRQRAARSTIMG